MKRRWIIRSFFFVLLVLCIGGWAWSYFRWTVVMFDFGGGLLEFNATDGGQLLVGWDTPDRPRGRPDGLEWVRVHSLPLQKGFVRGKNVGEHYFWGFGVSNYHSKKGYGSVFGVDVPFWFVTGIIAIPTVYAWRKTRSKPNPSTAFPVEAVKK
jgi:hypothetical protein